MSKKAKITPITDWPISKEVRTLPCRLTSSEIGDYNDELKQCLDEIGDLAAEKAAMASQYKARIEGKQLRVSQLANICSAKAEPREQTCLWVYEVDGVDRDGEKRFDPKMKTLFRVDLWIGDEPPMLGEVVETADITDTDRERSLPMEGI